ncbi:phosphoesterase PA-phosphatase related protein [Paenibacillus curdlanolyticus YK9]|uniref:Phosphoesterase PA-phosphatase related protein n=1 Tax=Paenibacillus curdlanolyticus YK9 TaxID=717606 RepID=E0I4X8_9BACL|nr:phosphatase PAP2 family protein [Paenibacillus curdlanolyticus]EFM12020.1 phosphoesterase PA-phosphatase related protein [Paenibacillus curdlanolyticus YK9]
MKKQQLIAGAAFALCIIVFVIIAFTLPEAGPARFDERVAQAVHSLAGDSGEGWWKAVTQLGSSVAIVVVSLAYAAWFGWRNRTFGALWIPLAGIAAYGVNQVLKMMVDRPRPAGAWGIETDGASFPSGNAMLAAAVYGTIAASFVLYAAASRVVKATVGAVGFIIIIAVGFSRLYFSVHYFTDILAGYAAGACVMLAALHLLNMALSRVKRY